MASENYNIIYGGDFEISSERNEFINYINKSIKEGWIPLGGFVIVNDCEVYQTMYKPDPKSVLDRISKLEIEEAVLSEL
jgi:hypothetical protein